MTVLYFSAGWLAGLWLASHGSVPAVGWGGFALVGLGAAGIWRGRRGWFPAAVLLLGLGMGGGRFALARPVFDARHIVAFNDGPPLSLVGRVTGEPEILDRGQRLKIRVERVIDVAGEARATGGLVLAQIAPYPRVAYGARLQLTGRLRTPPEDEAFSYRDYLARRGIYSLMSRPEVVVLKPAPGHSVYGAILRLKSRAQAVIVRLVPDPAAGLLRGILLGDDRGLPEDLAADFRATGMTHIIAISGFNISILVASLMNLTAPLLGPRRAVWLALSGISLYTVLVGADAAVVRAAIMGGLYLLTHRLLGRNSYRLAALLVAAVIMTLINPHALWDLGFQLSFAATLSLMLYADPFTDRVRAWLRRRLHRRLVERLLGLLSEAVIITLAAQVLTLPLMLAAFDQLSLVSLPANALILPAQPAVMTWGGLATLIGLVAPRLAQPVAWVAWLFLGYTIGLVRALARLPFAVVPLSLGPAGLLLLYGLILGLSLAGRLPAERRLVVAAWLRPWLTTRLVLGGGGLAVVLVLAWGLSQPDGHLHVAFLDVGQGDAILIQTPHGRQILVDGGLYPSRLNDRLGRQMPFWDRTLDIVVATHPDADHITGLPGVFDRYRVDRLVTDGAPADDNPTYQALLEAAAAGGTGLQPAQAGAVFVVDGVRLAVVHPGATRDPENRNENSVSLHLTYGHFSLLLTGDGESEAERAMVAVGRPLTALVFKAGHHGSRTSSNAFFLAAVRPRYVVVSAGADNRFGHPHPEVLQRATAAGAAVLRTDELGTIELITDGRRLWWRAH